MIEQSDFSYGDRVLPLDFGPRFGPNYVTCRHGCAVAMVGYGTTPSEPKTTDEWDSVATLPQVLPRDHE